jgi:hypothetical protein
MREHGVEALLMGGQACVLYGAAEFSRIVDFAILASTVNLERLRLAMDALRDEVMVVPPFEARYLERLRHGTRGQGQPVQNAASDPVGASRSWLLVSAVFRKPRCRWRFLRGGPVTGAGGLR